MKKKIANLVLSYLKFFAKLQIAKIRFLQKLNHRRFDVVGITGSSGKSSVLNISEALLSPIFKVKTNEGHNSESGLPLSIIGLKITNYSPLSWLSILFLCPIKFLTNWRTYDVLLLEMGIDSPRWPKNMEYLLSVVSPNIAIFLNVGSVHLLNFGSIDQIAIEKAKLANSAQIAIINGSDKLVKKYTHTQNIINIIPTKIDFANFYLPDIYQISFGAALALAKIFKVSSKEAIKNIKDNFVLPPSRSSILKGIKNTTLIDSSYNSSPDSCLEMLKFLATFKTKKIAILGDMRELGSASAAEHKKVYESALKSADLIISVGPETYKYFGAKSQKFNFWWQAASYLKTQISGNETILIKGSQNNIYLEEIVKTLLENKSDSVKLCRQSKYWQKIKDEFRRKI